MNDYAILQVNICRYYTVINRLLFFLCYYWQYQKFEKNTKGGASFIIITIVAQYPFFPIVKPF